MDAKALGIDVRFFMASIDNVTVNYQSDETALRCVDDYNALPFKTREICRWARGKAVDYVLLVDTDTYVNVKNIPMEIVGYDYAGKIDRPIGKPFRYETVDRQENKEVIQRCYPWASGGWGYFLSKKALESVAFDYPSSWAEDLWVGQVIGAEEAEGQMHILDISGGTYSLHHPEHGEIYEPKVLTDWLYGMHKEAHAS